MFAHDRGPYYNLKTFTVTNVTLKTGSNYQVEFVNPTNASQIYAMSDTFDVKAAGSESPTSRIA